MKKFSFSLQTVLNVKITAEDLIKQELAKAQYQLKNEEGKLTFLHEEWNATCSCQPRDVFEMLQQQYYRDLLKNNIEVQKKIIIQQQELIKKIRDRAVRAERDRKVLEKLKDGQIKEYRQQIFAEEQKFLDEIAVLRFTRKKIGK